MARDHNSARLEKIKKGLFPEWNWKKKVLYGQQVGKRLRSAALNVNKVTESVFEQADIAL